MNSVCPSQNATLPRASSGVPCVNVWPTVLAFLLSCREATAFTLVLLIQFCVLPRNTPSSIVRSSSQTYMIITDDGRAELIFPVQVHPNRAVVPILLGLATQSFIE